MGFKNLRELDFALKNAFFKIRNDIKRIEEINKETRKDISVVRESLIEFNSLKKKIEGLERKIDDKNFVDLGDDLEKKRGFSKFFFWRKD